MTVLPISAGDTHDLRHRVLRPNQPKEACVYPGDDAPGTAHFGAYRDGQLLGIASLYCEDQTETPSPSHRRIRGMAVEPEHQHRGIGRALIQACIQHAQANDAATLWCNARTTAAPFYQTCGFTITGPQFDIPHIGPHYLMVYTLK